MTTTEKIYTVREAAAVLRVSEQTLRRLIRDGRIRATRTVDSSHGVYRIRAADLGEFFDTRPAEQR